MHPTQELLGGKATKPTLSRPTPWGRFNPNFTMNKHKNDLWKEFISKENFARAAAKAVRGRKSKPEVARFLANADANLEKLRVMVAAGEFRTSPYRTMEITDPKKRTIYILPFYPDRIIHHAIMNIVAPIWERMFIRDSYACITGRGLHTASRRVMAFARKNTYVLKCDIRKFYPSIDHNIMFAAVARSVGDIRIVAILRDIIYSAPGPAGGRNLPIGNLCSQWMGNLYLHAFDMFVKSILGARDYLRYCDDFCLFSNNRAQLREWRERIREFLAERLRLTFSRAEIFPIANGLDFVGYRHFPDFILLRKRTMKGLKKRMLKIGRMGEIPPDQVETIRGAVASANGWMKYACSYNIRKSIGFARLKKKVGIKV